VTITVRARIAIAMTALVAANLLAATVSAVYFARADRYQNDLVAASARVALASDASERVTEFMAEAESFAVAARSKRPEDQTDGYGRLARADAAAGSAVSALAKSEGADGDTVTQDWSDVRIGTFSWLNAQAGADGSALRLWLSPSGALNTNNVSNIPTPEYAAAEGLFDIRQAVRTRFDGFRDGIIRRVRDNAAAQAQATGSAEQLARNTAQTVTLGLAGLSLLVAVLAGVWVYRGTAIPLRAARRFADRVAAGELDATFPEHRGDEIGHLTAAIENMKDVVVRDLRAMKEMAGAVLVTADGVSHAANTALDSLRSGACSGDRLEGEVSAVARQADMLTELANGMLEA
jgi:HAMP domain-containing protein